MTITSGLSEPVSAQFENTVDLFECQIAMEWALRRYTREVGAGVGLESESCWCEVAEQCTAYLPLPCAPVSHPGREAALVWDEAHGWAIGIETSSGEDLLIQAWYGPDRIPDPPQVAAFTRAVLSGRPAGQSTPPATPAGPVRAQLAQWAQMTAHLSDPQQQNS